LECVKIKFEYKDIYGENKVMDIKSIHLNSDDTASIINTNDELYEFDNNKTREVIQQILDMLSE
jgi:hypothetical protein